MITQQREQRDRYDELERRLLRGEYMTTGEMKEFAKLWRGRKAAAKLIGTVFTAAAGAFAVIAGATRARATTADEATAAQPQVDESFLGLGEGVCGFLDRPVKS